MNEEEKEASDSFFKQKEEERAIYSFYREFDAIPAALVRKAVNTDEIKILAPTYEDWKAKKLQNELSDYEDEDETDYEDEDIPNGTTYKGNYVFHSLGGYAVCKELEDAYDEEIPEIPRHPVFFSPRNREYKDWIKGNLKKVVDCGFIVYDIPIVGLCIGVNAWTYNYLYEEWMNLYEAINSDWYRIG